MKIAVTYENGEIFQHFGHTQNFKIYDVESGAVTSSKVVSTQGSGHGALAELLKQLEVNTLICGGIGAGAQDALVGAGIQLYGGVQGKADQAVSDFLAGNLAFAPNATCTHHGEQHDHSCGEHQSHSCGQHTCGNHN